MTAPRALRRLAAAVAFVTLALTGSGGFAATQMFKCIIGGRTVYQQQACPADAEPPKDASTMAAATRPPADASATASAAAPRKPKPGAPPASSVPATPR
jgi:hypothetical protein